MYHLLSEKSVEVAVPVDVLFTYATNLENFPTWFPGALSIQAQDSRDADEVGKSYIETIALPLGRQTEVKIQVTEVQRPVRIATEGSYRLLLPRMEMDFHALDEKRTRMQWRMYSRRTGFSIRMLLPLFRIIVGARSRRALAQLKAYLEHVNNSATD